MKKLKILLPYKTQSIYIGTSIFHSRLQKYVTDNKIQKVFIVVDADFWREGSAFVLSKISTPYSLYVIDTSSEGKDIDLSVKILKKINSFRLGRRDLIIAIGGGFVGDIAGFVAQVYLRGLRYIQVSTNLMSSCDAIIGKVAVNVDGQKNRVGAFSTPDITICDFNFQHRNYEANFNAVSEVVKHNFLARKTKKDYQNGLITIHKYLDNFQDKKTWEKLIEQSLIIKSEFVLADPYDTSGQHKALSLGHTFANVLESILPMPHGEAVWLGMIMAFKASSLLGINKKFCKYHMEILGNMWQKDYTEINISFDEIIENMACDKLAIDSSISLVLPIGYGKIKIFNNIDQEIIKKCFGLFFKVK